MKYNLKDVKGNYEKEDKYQLLYRSVDFFFRKPKLSGNYYHWYANHGMFRSDSFYGTVGHMEAYALANADRTIYWLEPEDEWFEKLYETGYDEKYSSF